MFHVKQLQILRQRGCTDDKVCAAFLFGALFVNVQTRSVVCATVFLVGLDMLRENVSRETFANFEAKGLYGWQSLCGFLFGALFANVQTRSAVCATIFLVGLDMLREKCFT